MKHRFIISLGSVGTMAAYNLISKNEDVIMPPYPETPYWLRNYASLSAMAGDRLLLQVHSVNDLDLIERIFEENEETACLLLIREPYDSLASWINASLFHAMSKTLSPPENMRAFVSNLIDVGPYTHLVRSARIADKAKETLVLDVTALTVPRLPETQRMLSDLFGIGNSYGSILEKENSYFARFLYEVAMPVDFLDGKLQVKFSGYGDIVDNQQMVKLFEFPSPGIWADFMPEGRPVTAYMQLTRDFNNFVIPMGNFSFVVESVKAWTSRHLNHLCEKIKVDFETCMPAYEGAKLDDLGAILNADHGLFLEEARAFYEAKFPHITRFWSSQCTGR